MTDKPRTAEQIVADLRASNSAYAEAARNASAAARKP